MKILHMSDTHGRMPVPLDEDYDLIVHSGDLLPNMYYGNPDGRDARFQEYWLKDNAARFNARYWQKPLLITPGNHDWYNVVPALVDIGIDARLLCNGMLEVGGITFWGNPWTPSFFDWNWMCGPYEMEDHLSGYLESGGGIDVFVSHGPMYGVLDKNDVGERCGCKVLRSVMQDVSRPPKWLLHGHIHEAAGTQGWSRGMRVSNAACIQRIIEV